MGQKLTSRKDKPMFSFDSVNDGSRSSESNAELVERGNKLPIVHIVGGNSRDRAAHSRLADLLKFEPKFYADDISLLNDAPVTGVIIVFDGCLVCGADAFLRTLTEAGIWIPVVVASDHPETENVVRAIKAGAIDYLSSPPDSAALAEALHQAFAQADKYAEAQHRLVNARTLLASLSDREREVLDLLSQGMTNKAIARALEISPRTVEIHRAHMMEKLGATHAADAVRLRLDSDYEESVIG